MKRLIFAIIVAVMSFGASAQFTTASSEQKATTSSLSEVNLQVGSEIMIDGVPACVFYVDDEGHGLAFSSPATTEKQLLKLSKNAIKNNTGFLFQQYEKMRGKRAQIFLEKGAYIDWNKHKKDKNYGKHWVAVSDYLSADGSKNQEIIEDYCKANGVDMETAFPAQYYASKLGKGWFIPADDELEKLSMYLYGHYGENDKCSAGDFEIKKDPNRILRGNLKKVDKSDDLSDAPLCKWVLYDVKDELNFHLREMKGIVSSRMYSAPRGFQALHPWQTSGFKKSYYVHINDGISGKNTLTYNYIVPVYRF